MTSRPNDSPPSCPPGFHLRGASVEVCTACNHRCTYCPVSLDPFSQEVMTPALFSEALRELAGLGVHLRRVSLNHYNEPFLDPFLVDRVEEAATHSFFDVVLLNTNLSVMPVGTLDRLSRLRDRVEFNVNLPTTDRAIYCDLHGKDHLDRVIANLERVRSAGFATRVNVQESVLSEDAPFDPAKLPEGVCIEHVQSNSRAGLVAPLALTVRHRQVLRGCRIDRPTSYVHIGVDGAVFFCCEDYRKELRVGTIGEQPLAAILRSPEMTRYLSYMNGSRVAPNDFICRNCELAITG